MKSTVAAKNHIDINYFKLYFFLSIAFFLSSFVFKPVTFFAFLLLFSAQFTYVCVI